MQLGVVICGAGVHAAAGIGVLEELLSRGIEPCAVCGMQAGAWPAALYCAGLDAQGLQCALDQAARMGRRLADPAGFLRRPDPAARKGLFAGRRLEYLIRAQTGDRLLALCPRRGVFLCRAVRTGRRVAFSTQLYMQEEGVMLSMQAGVGFAARAAMALPPFLPAVSWMGSLLVPEEDTAYACRQLLQLGAQRVLVVQPEPSLRHEPDLLEMCALHARYACISVLPEQAALLSVTIPDRAGALSLDQIRSCAEAGRFAAQRELDRLLEQLGMALCRVIPFRRGIRG